MSHPCLQKDKKLAFEFYLKAASLCEPDALAPLERLATNGNAANQYALSAVYATFFKNPERADFWRNEAKTLETFKQVNFGRYNP